MKKARGDSQECATEKEDEGVCTSIICIVSGWFSFSYGHQDDLMAASVLV